MKTRQKQNKTQSVRLPRHILPERYAITLKPDLESFTFEGEEVISLNVTKADKTVTLHARDLEVVTAEFLRGKKEVWTSKITYDTKKETVTLVFPKQLPKGKGKIRLVFRGVLNDKLRGYYRSSFVHNGQTKHLATTQFEATDARRAFPCFDEPNIKAVFDVTLVVPVHHEAISNTLPAVVKEHESGFKAVTFKPTPKMSTYLLAFISGELESIQKKTKSGVLVRVFTTPGKTKQAKFALDFSVKTLDFYEKYFESKYPLPILDLLAIPDFMSGAMENWGAVTFRETALLIDEDNSSLAMRQYVATVIAHELAHQWFGNLVTMDWWTHLWLNEGFASYIEYLPVHHVFPEWEMWTQFMALDYAAGMEKDQLVNTHPIEVEVHHPDEIDEIFDDISYRKGSSVIRMLAEYLGPEVFRKGLVHYLKRHSYKNATTGDLWEALERISKKPVKKIMGAWTGQSGFPLLSVERKGDGLELSQKRFYINPVAAKQSKDNQLWPIPVSMKLGQKNAESILVTAKTANVPAGAGVKLNVNETGFYRVRYTPEMLKALSKQIEKKELSVIDRWGVISNAWSLAESGDLPVEAVLELCLSYRKETDFTVFSEMLSGLLRLGSFYRTEKKWFKSYESFVRFMLAPTVKRLGWDKKPGESHGDTLLRSSCLAAFGSYGDEATVVEAVKRFTAVVRNGVSAVPADIRGAVYNLTALAGGVPEFNYLKRLYIAEELPEEKNRLGRALCSFESEKLIEKALEFSLSKHVKTQDSWRFMVLTGMHSRGHGRLWKFLQTHWADILKIYGSGGHLLVRTVQSLSHLSDLELHGQIKKFFATHPKPGADRTLEQVLEHIHTSALWKERSREGVKKFAVKFAGSGIR